jgi:hypothetical protein
MGNTQLGITVASLLCSILGIMLIMKMPMKSPPLLAACAVSCCCSSSQSASLVNDVQKRMKSESESE